MYHVIILNIASSISLDLVSILALYKTYLTYPPTPRKISCPLWADPGSEPLV
jgi:hypothetical protein